MPHPDWHAADQKSVLGSTTSETVAAPDNLSEGDLLVAMWMLRQENPSAGDFTVPSGWELRRSRLTGDASSPNVAIWTKVATAAEPADYTFSYTGTATENALVIGRVSGFDATVDLQVEVDAQQVGGTSFSLASWPDNPDLDYLRLAAYACRTSSGSHTGVSITSPAGFTQLFDDVSRAGFSAAVFEEDLTGHLATQVDASNTNVRWAAFYVVIREDLAVNDPPPVTSGLVCNIDPQTLEGYVDAEHVGTIEDRSTGKRWDGAQAGVVLDADGIQGHPALRLGESSGDDLEVRDADGPVDIAASAGCTMFVVWRPLAWIGTNPGIWRSGSSSGGNEFMILQGGSGRPWVRWSGSDVFRPSGGYAVGRLTESVLVYRVADAASVDFRAEGFEWYDVAHAQSTGGFSIHNLGQHNQSHRPDALYGQLLIYDRDLSDAEIVSVQDWLRTRWSVDEDDEENYGTGVWSWFADPRALRYVDTEDKTYVGFVSGSDVMVAAYDHATGEITGGLLEEAFEGDDHANPVLRVKSDGRIQAIYSKHNGSNMWFRETVNPEDVTSWQAASSESWGTSMTYPNPIDLSDRVVLHFRSNLNGNDPHYVESTDDGETWGSAEHLFLGAGFDRPYLKCAKHPTLDRIDYVLVEQHPQEDNTVKNSLYHFYREGTDFYTSDGTLIGGMATLPLEASDITLLWDGPTENADCWQWGIAHDGDGDPVIVFATMSDDGGSLTNNSIHTARYARWNGTSWDINPIVSMGKTIHTGGEAGYSAGIALDPTDVSVVWVAVEDSAGTEATLHRYTTSDGGSTWTGEELIGAGLEENVRPVVPLNRHDDVAVLYFRGDYQGWAGTYDVTLLSLAYETVATTGLNDSFHPHSSDELTLLGAVGLQDSFHPHSSDQLALVPLTVLQDSFHPHSSDELVVLASVGLEDSFHPHNSGLLNISEAIDSFPVVAKIRPNPVKPAGIDGQVLFRNVYLAITPDTGGRFTFTPVLDGEKLADEAVILDFTSDNRRQEYEIALTRHYTVAGEERVRYGLRGTEFTFELEVEDTHGEGNFISIDGAEVEVTLVRERHPDSPFDERDVVPVDRAKAVPFFFGAGARVARYGTVQDDLGSAIEGFVQPNFVAPEGVGAEYVFTNLYLYLSRWNESLLTLSLTPLVDGDPSTEQTFDLEGVATSPTREVIELGLLEPYDSGGSERLRYAPRGTWFSFQLKTVGALPDGDVVLEGVSLEYEVVRETEEAH